MTAEKRQFLDLVRDYRAAMARAAALLNAKSEREPGFQRRQERAGYLDAEHRVGYQFHGVGCYVTLPEADVDFDFGMDGRCDALDAWFLFAFLDRNPAVKATYPLVLSHEHVVQLLQELEDEGLAAKNVDPSRERTYYLTADLHHPNPPTVTWYAPDEDLN